MTELLDVVVEAHGGLDRWNQLNSIKAKLTVAGAIWEFKQKPQLPSGQRSQGDFGRMTIRLSSISWSSG